MTANSETPAAWRRAPLTIVCLLLAVVATAPGCGGGGGGGGPTSPPPPPPVDTTQSTSFSPAGAPGSQTIYIPEASSSDTTLVLEIRANEVSDLYGVSFDLEYPAAIARYDPAGTTAGDFLGAASEVELLVSETTDGQLVVGLSKLGAQPGANGSGLLLSLRFVAEADGSGAIRFSQQTAFDSSGAAQAGVSWIGGTLDADV